tara:strand:+ start:211 stop:492 length:282 start_codon:yes stop_codon:yes gene_type:complete
MISTVTRVPQKVRRVKAIMIRTMKYMTGTRDFISFSCLIESVVHEYEPGKIDFYRRVLFLKLVLHLTDERHYFGCLANGFMRKIYGDVDSSDI